MKKIRSDRPQTKKTDDPEREIGSYVESHYPIIFLATLEEEHADRMIANILARSQRRSILEWNMARGCVCFDTKAPLSTYVDQPEYRDLPDTLNNWLNQELDGHFLVIKDAYLALRDNPLAVARLKALANKIVHDDSTYATIFLVASQSNVSSIVPPDLEKFITIFEPPPPSEKDIKRLIDQYARQYGRDSVNDRTAARLVTELRGLSSYEITRLLNRGIQLDGAIKEDDIELVRDAKRQIIKKGGILEMVEVSETVRDIGGLKELKKWLRSKRIVMSDLSGAREYGVEPPKGVVIVGMPGCGKSLTAKATSTMFKLPLLRLDVGAVMGKYVGESEANMRRALRLAEDVSPCVLWVDELEKAFAGTGSSGHEITRRLFGNFLTWMQEKTTPVFVVATANDVSSLPPELLRKGRFDDIFYVDFPDGKERGEILGVHLKKRLQKRKQDLEIDIPKLVRDTEGFSGADLESVVKDAIEQAFVEQTSGEKRQPDLNLLLLRLAKDTVPMAKVMEKKKEEYDTKFREMGIKSASRRIRRADKRVRGPVH